MVILQYFASSSSALFRECICVNSHTSVSLDWIKGPFQKEGLAGNVLFWSSFPPNLDD